MPPTNPSEIALEKSPSYFVTPSVPKRGEYKFFLAVLSSIHNDILFLIIPISFDKFFFSLRHEQEHQNTFNSS